MTDEMESKNQLEIASFEDAKKILEKCKHANYIIKYLEDLEANSVVIEKEYIDKDYMIDFSLFYARSFDKIQKFTTRLHFFTLSKSDLKTKFKKIFKEGNKAIGNLNKEYLGFVVIKPIKDEKNKNFIGRTVLKTYPEEVRNKSIKRHFLKIKNEVCLFGVPLEVNSLPYQAQERGVSACATVALWVATYPLNKKFDVPIFSLYEITQKSISSSFPARSRNFPTSGLNIYQIIGFINEIGLEKEVINYEGFNEIPLCEVVRAYINFGLPLIGILELTKRSERIGQHAIVISGYEEDENGIIKHLYVHDDQIGPYCKVKPEDKEFIKWKYEGSDVWKDYDDVKVDKLIIPLHEKIRTDFSKIFSNCKMLQQMQQQKYPELKDKEGHLLLTTVQDYKNNLLSREIVSGERRDGKEMSKDEILISNMPRFLWVWRVPRDNKTTRDYIFDATHPILTFNIIMIIEYKSE